LKHLEIETKHGFKWLIVAFFVFSSLSLSAQNPLNEDYLSLDPEAVTGVSFGPVTALAVAPSDASLWIGTEDEGILRIGRKGNRIRYKSDASHLLSNNVKEMCFVSASALYILYDDGRITRYTSTEGFSTAHLTDEAIDHIIAGIEPGNLIYATKSGKIFQTDGAGHSAMLADVREPAVVLSLIPSGDIYIVGEDSRVVKKINQSSVETKTSALPAAPTSVFVQDNGVFWAGTGQGLYCWIESSWTRYSSYEGLPSNRVKSILSDEDGSLLIATGKGVVRLNVSNSNVSNSNIYFPDDSYGCGVKSNSSGSIFLFGGDRGIAVISSSTEAVDLPWNEVIEDDFSPMVSHRNLLWIIPLILVIGLLGYVAGRLLHQEGSNVPESFNTETIPWQSHKPVIEKPNIVPTPAKTSEASNTHTQVQPSVHTASTTPSPSPVRDEVIAAIDKLRKDKAPEFSYKVWQMIEGAYTDSKFSVEEIASRLLLTRVHVNRKLQQEIGVSPSALIKARRMAAARELMQKGGLTLPQIADKAGFSSAAYLSASFKDYYGQSPSELMRSSANKLH